MKKNNALFEGNDQTPEEKTRTSIGTSANRPLDKQPSDREKEVVADYTDYFDPDAGPLGGFRGYTDLNQKAQPVDVEVETVSSEEE